MSYETNINDKAGKVWLVGAGPSDAGLITVKGKAILERAEVIVYDRLAGQGVLHYAPREAEFIYVGKQSSNHVIPQEEIQKILIREAKAGKQVVRLKGGDPFVFGRGAEEIAELAEHGIAYEVVPGITSAVAVPAYQGIAVTHRDLASSLHIITAHKKQNEPLQIPYEQLAKTEGTLVFLMGVKTLNEICEGLLQAGMAEGTPVVILEKGTTAVQREVCGTLQTIGTIAATEKIESPAVILVGKVGKLNQYNWYEKLPLSGLKVMVTRPNDSSYELVQMLREQGAEVLEAPTIRTEPISDRKFLNEVLGRIDEYDWMVFMSPSGVRYFFRELQRQKVDIRKLSSLKIAAIGSASCEALEERGLYPELVPETYDGESLGQALAKVCGQSDNILMIRASKGDSECSDILQQEVGAAVTEVAIYQTVYEKLPYLDYRGEIENRISDYVIFTSGSTVEGFVKAAEGLDFTLVKAICIGSKTAGKARGYGMQTVCSDAASMESMVSLLKRIKDDEDILWN